MIHARHLDESAPALTLPHGQDRAALSAAGGRVAVLVNARARALRAGGLERRVRRALGPLAGSFTVATGADMADAARRLALTGPAAVAVIGGDGSAAAALRALSPLGIPVAPLPGGTMNRLARHLQGTGELRAALAGLAGARIRRIDAGEAAGRLFFVAAGFGPLMRLNAVRETFRREGAGAAMALARHLLGDTRFTQPLAITAPTGVTRRMDALVLAPGPVDSAFGFAPERPGDTALEAAAARFGGWDGPVGLATRVLLGMWRGTDAAWTGPGDGLSVTARDGAALDALLDGEPARLDGPVVLRHRPAWGLVLAAR